LLNRPLLLKRARGAAEPDVPYIDVPHIMAFDAPAFDAQGRRLIGDRNHNCIALFDRDR
jgi:hypothetical protein